MRKFNVAYFTASCDPADGKRGNISFAKSIEADYPILSDPSKKTAKAYGVVTATRPFPHRWTFYIGKDGKILGAHMFGPEYAELINVFSLAIKLGLTAAQVKAMPAAYPTGASDLGSMF